jgi:hypothetical protein
MTKWEYGEVCIVSGSNKKWAMIQVCNYLDGTIKEIKPGEDEVYGAFMQITSQMGMDGWELVAVANNSWYFKRPIVEV